MAQGDVDLAPYADADRKAMAAYANMDHAQAGDYEQVKAAILRSTAPLPSAPSLLPRYSYLAAPNSKTNPATEQLTRHSFPLVPYECSETPDGTSPHLDRIVGNMPLRLQVWVRERKPKTVNETGEIADDYVLAQKETVQEKRCHKCGQKGHLAGSYLTAGNSAGSVIDIHAVAEGQLPWLHLWLGEGGNGKRGIYNNSEEENVSQSRDFGSPRDHW